MLLLHLLQTDYLVQLVTVILAICDIILNLFYVMLQKTALAKSQLSLNTFHCYLVIPASAIVVFFCVKCYLAPPTYILHYTIGLLLGSISLSKCICNTKGDIVYNHANVLKYDIDCSLVEIYKIYINQFYSFAINSVSFLQPLVADFYLHCPALWHRGTRPCDARSGWTNSPCCRM